MLEDRIRQSLDNALADLRARVDGALSEAVTEFIKARNDAQDAAVAEARASAAADAEAALARAVAETETRVRASFDDIVATAREDERRRATAEVRAIVESEAAQRLEHERQAHQLALSDAAHRAQQALSSGVADAGVREREAAMAGFSRLLDGVRALDAASSLTELLDALTDAAAREAPRAAVLVLKGERVQGWKVRGFGERDEQPKTVDLSLAEAGVIGYAVGAARPATTNDAPAATLGSGFAALPPDRMGLAVPVIVGGRVVAVVYADSGAADTDSTVPASWPESIEVLARHAARCLETLTVQRAVQTPVQRVNVPPAVRAATPGAERPA
ncbi:MAG: GAF domain-containing protein [Vicinamibacteria bacterium]